MEDIAEKVAACWGQEITAWFVRGEIRLANMCVTLLLERATADAGHTCFVCFLFFAFWRMLRD